MTEDDALTMIANIGDLPPGARITSAVLVYDYLDGEARDCWGVDYLGSSPTTNRIGLLRLAEAQLVARQLAEDEDT